MSTADGLNVIIRRINETLYNKFITKMIALDGEGGCYTLSSYKNLWKSLQNYQILLSGPFKSLLMASTLKAIRSMQVPQSSLLGSTLFLLYINYLSRNILK